MFDLIIRTSPQIHSSFTQGLLHSPFKMAAANPTSSDLQKLIKTQLQHNQNQRPVPDHLRFKKPPFNFYTLSHDEQLLIVPEFVEVLVAENSRYLLRFREMIRYSMQAP